MADSTRNMPALAVTALWGAVASMIGGFLIASYTISGITPAYVAPPRPERQTARIVPPDGWREANYRRIGLWDESTLTERGDIAVQAAGSSRL